MFKHNQKVICEIEGTKITDARISIDKDGTPYICQNEADGVKASNLLGYEYAWCLNQDFTERYIKNLRPSEKSFDFPEIGDEYKDNEGDSKFVLGVAGRVIFMSSYSDKDEYCDEYTKEGLIECGFTIVQEDKTEEELTVKQVCEELGRDIKIIK